MDETKQAILTLKKKIARLKADYEGKKNALEYSIAVLSTEESESEIPETGQISSNGAPAIIKKKKLAPKNFRTTKVRKIIRRTGRFLHNKEIIKLLHPTLKDETRIRKESKGLTVTLSTLKKNGELASYQASNSLKDTYWGFPEWIDESGNIIAGHEHQAENVMSLFE